jgi:hypothetical protein
MTYTEPTFCADCHEPTSLCQCGDPIARPDYDALAARLAEAERDAARYRWLRGANIVDWDAIPFPAEYDHPDDALDDIAKMLDASIDACMAPETVSEVQK